ncbi:ABC-type transport auxiliary lipoprotein family protein [Rhizorhabdus phycosphaerae]|uniref:ABC-type transport auxiliary lipoprotein family protein n=1 Tax=Rhizorhabdus phycosphaerae TaxID=2711156 RepID=UPI0013EBA9EE|nr:ABC-type transport auxiliary lipoprotein family protein [Rhizorhabdus phycosphaerae]
MLRRSLIAISAAAALSGCVSLGEDPPERLVGLTAQATVPAGTAKVARDTQAISVSVPALPSQLRNQRIAVQTGISYAYLPKVAWVDTPAGLFRSLLAETIEAKTGRFVPDHRNASITPDNRLAGTLTAFQLLGGQNQVLVTYDATLAKSGSDEVKTRRFEARVPVAGEDSASVAAGLNQAANQVAADVADWIGPN